MPGNNPNQNAALRQNKSKSPLKGFPGMEIPAKRGAKSHQEVADARKQNVAVSEHSAKRPTGMGRGKKRPL